MANRYIIRDLTDKKHRTRAAKVLGLYAEKLGKPYATIEAGNTENWFVIYEHNEKRSGIVVYRHPNQCVIIQYAAIENEGQGQLKALLAATRRHFDEPVSGVNLDMDKPEVWQHLGFTNHGMVDFIPHLFNVTLKEAFPLQSDRIGKGNNPQEFLAYMDRFKATSGRRIVISPIL